MSTSCPAEPHRRWPRPPAAIPAEALTLPPAGARVTVAGLVILRQRPGTAKGVIFLTLEDETGVVNVVVWRALYERFRRAVIAGRMLRVTGRLQREAGVTHVIAERIEDISEMLDSLLAFDICRAADQPGSTAQDRRAPTPPARWPGRGVSRGRGRR